jgi:hypothetical protein
MLLQQLLGLPASNKMVGGAGVPAPMFCSHLNLAVLRVAGTPVETALPTSGSWKTKLTENLPSNGSNSEQPNGCNSVVLLTHLRISALFFVSKHVQKG